LTHKFRHFVIPDSVIKDCWSCLDRKEGLSLLVPCFPNSGECLPNLTFTDYQAMEKDPTWFGIDWIHDMESTFHFWACRFGLKMQPFHLPFAFSRSHFNRSSGKLTLPLNYFCPNLGSLKYLHNHLHQKAWIIINFCEKYPDKVIP
jgi:hypothetical protein